MTETNKPIYQSAGCKCFVRGDRYVFTCIETGAEHSISSRPDITSPERLRAHWKGFVQGNTKDVVFVEDLTPDKLAEKIKTAKERHRKDYDAFYRDFEVVCLNEEGERIDEPFFCSRLSMKAIRECFENKEVHGLMLQGWGVWFEAGAGVRDRWATAEGDGDGWGLEVIK